MIERRSYDVQSLRDVGVNYSPRHLSRLVQEKRFPAPFTLSEGGKRLWDARTVDEWIEARRKPKPAPRPTPRRKLIVQAPRQAPRRRLNV